MKSQSEANLEKFKTVLPHVPQWDIENNGDHIIFHGWSELLDLRVIDAVEFSIELSFKVSPSESLSIGKRNLTDFDEVLSWLKTRLEATLFYPYSGKYSVSIAPWKP